MNVYKTLKPQNCSGLKSLDNFSICKAKWFCFQKRNTFAAKREAAKSVRDLWVILHASNICLVFINRIASFNFI